MEREMDKVLVDRKVFEAMLNKLAEQPYHEVAHLLGAAQQSATVVEGQEDGTRELPNASEDE